MQLSVWSCSTSDVILYAHMQRKAPVRAGEELQVPAGAQELCIVLDDCRQALPQKALLAGLSSIEGNALCILSHPHQPIPAQPINLRCDALACWQIDTGSFCGLWEQSLVRCLSELRVF